MLKKFCVDLEILANICYDYIRYCSLEKIKIVNCSKEQGTKPRA